MKSKDILYAHLRSPCGWSKNKDVAGTRRFRVIAEFLSFSGRLGSGSCNDQDTLKPILVQSVPGKFDGMLAFVMGEVLSLAITPLNEDACDSTLSGYQV
jgi:hypothetical protein